MAEKPVFVLVAGEASGDLIGGSIVRALLERYPDASFVGVGGPHMLEAGLTSWYSLNELSVMGIMEVLRHLPRLLLLRRNIADRVITISPTVFIGIDAPDFNLGLAAKVRAAGIPTVHVVSPSVWAWRESRMKTIARAVDLMLPLFPFERDYYVKHQQPATCIGHPLADEIPLSPPPPAPALSEFLLRSKESHYGAIGGVTKGTTEIPPVADEAEQQGRRYLAVMPGSRQGELKYIAPVFISVMAQLAARYHELHFLVPCANSRRARQIQDMLPLPGEHPWVGRIHMAIGGSRHAIAAAEAVLVASGTATLEAMLLKKPMVVAYRWHPLTHAIIAPLVKTPYVALPNLLAGRMLVPELVQTACSVEQVFDAVNKQLSDDDQSTARRAELLTVYEQLHTQLQCQAAQTAADEILRVSGLSASVVSTPQAAQV